MIKSTPGGLRGRLLPNKLQGPEKTSDEVIAEFRKEMRAARTAATDGARDALFKQVAAEGVFEPSVPAFSDHIPTRRT